MTIATPLPPDVQAAVDGIEAFARAHILPLHARHAELLENPRRAWAEDGRHAPDVVALIREIRITSAAQGFYQMCVPEHLGGGGLGHLAYFAAWRRLFHLCGPKNWLMLHALAHWAFGPSVLLENLTEEARARTLLPLIRGETSLCFGLSEPGAGSDAAAITTRAEPTATGWRITGRKIWTTNGPLADHCILFARAPEGITAFLLNTNAPGFHVHRVIRMFGSLGGDESEIALDGVHAEPWQIVGRPGAGFAAALTGINLGRIYNTARGVGYGCWALDLALQHCTLRHTFGRPLADHQGVTFPLADSATHLHAAHLMGLNAAMLLDQGLPAVKEVSMAKLYAVRVGVEAVDRAMQAHGAMGLTNEMGLTEAWHYLRGINIADGTNEILLRTIAQRLLKGDTQI